MSTNRLSPSVIRVKTAPILVPWSDCLALWCLCSSTAIAEPGWGWGEVQMPWLGCYGAFPPLLRENLPYRLFGAVQTHTGKVSDTQLCVFSL